MVCVGLLQATLRLLLKGPIDRGAQAALCHGRMSFHVFSCRLAPKSLIIKVIRWLVTDHPVHDKKLKTSRDCEIL
jgi:hypothetical protein